MAGKGDQSSVTITAAEGATIKTGDIAGHDVIKTTTTQVVDVEALGARLIELGDLVRELRRAVDSAPDVDERQRDDVVLALAGASKEIGAAGEEVRALSPGQPVPAALSTRIKEQVTTLAAVGKSVSSLVTSAQTLAHKLGPLMSTIGSMCG
jgi:hypothetical protein